MKKLQLVERACNAVAILLAIPTLASLTGAAEKISRPLLLLLLAVVFLLMYLSYLLRKRIHAVQVDAHNKLPINTVKATVVKSRIGYRYQPSNSKGGVRSGPPLYYLTFETVDGKRMELYVSRNVYFAIQQDAQGILRYKGDEFISFN